MLVRNIIQNMDFGRERSTCQEYLISMTESLIFNLAFSGARLQHQRWVRYGREVNLFINPTLPSIQCYKALELQNRLH